MSTFSNYLVGYIYNKINIVSGFVSKNNNVIYNSFFTEMKLTIVVFLLGLVTISAITLTEIKLSFCNKLKNHWAYDRLKLKETCLQIAKEVGSELCLDVIKIYFVFT